MTKTQQKIARLEATIRRLRKKIDSFYARHAPLDGSGGNNDPREAEEWESERKRARR